MGNTSARSSAGGTCQLRCAVKKAASTRSSTQVGSKTPAIYARRKEWLRIIGSVTGGKRGPGSTPEKRRTPARSPRRGALRTSRSARARAPGGAACEARDRFSAVARGRAGEPSATACEYDPVRLRRSWLNPHFAEACPQQAYRASHAHLYCAQRDV